MGQVLSLPFKLLGTTKTYIFGFFHYWCGKGRHSPFDKITSTFQPLHPLSTDTVEERLFKQHARIHLFTLTSNFYLYRKPHYRKGSYRDDLVDNLRNVAIPGTGIPLSWMAASRLVAVPFLLVGYPAVSLVAALHQWLTTKFATSISREYATRLLAPDDWFSYWRLNCVVTGLHALLNDTPTDYAMENKWTFLEQGAACGVPVSPFLNCPAIVVKHRNEEGGLGIHFYKNAVAGGDWIIQERIDNSAWVSSLLPSNAPLSTFRVITCSRAAIVDPTGQDQQQKEDEAVKKATGVTALSCVFRAGRAGAATDHDSILFDVDVTTGEIQGGTTNAHWYRLFGKVLNCPWRSYHTTTHHPDGDIPVTGRVVPDIRGMLALVEESHAKLCPRVPFCGWDVVLSADERVPVCLLEVNLSCNFFRGSFDQKVRTRSSFLFLFRQNKLCLFGMHVADRRKSHTFLHTPLVFCGASFGPLARAYTYVCRCTWTLSTTHWPSCKINVSRRIPNSKISPGELETRPLNRFANFILYIIYSQQF